jgi:hypothetical protein
VQKRDRTGDEGRAGQRRDAPGVSIKICVTGYLATEFRDAKKVFVTIRSLSIMPSAHDRRIGQEPVRVSVCVPAKLGGLDPP